MATTLGLDIGTNSIGWALIEDGQKLIKAGVRIFPKGIEDKGDASKNAARRNARLIRRQYDRWHKRRDALRRLQKELGLLETDAEKMLDGKSLYYLRVKGLDEALTPAELGRVLTHLNSRRGFLSNKKLERAEAEAEPEAEKPARKAAKPKKAGAEEEKETTQGLKVKMTAFHEAIKAAGFRTPGEYFYDLFAQNEGHPNAFNPLAPVKRIRKQHVYRSDYEAEFDLLMACQRQFHAVLTDRNLARLKSCIYSQRPLKSQKHLLGECRYERETYMDRTGKLREKGKKVCPRSHWLFQEYRVWNLVNNLRITDASRQEYRRPLTSEERQTVFNALQSQEKLTITELKGKEILNLSTKTKINVDDGGDSDTTTSLKGNSTEVRMRRALGAAWPTGNSDESVKEKHRLWHTLHFFDNEEKLVAYVQKAWDWDLEMATRYAKVMLQDDYSNLSMAAIRKILPWLEKGYGESEAVQLAGYKHHSWDEDKEGKTRELSDQIAPMPNHAIRNPVVQAATAEIIRLVNAVIKEFGKPDTIRVELPREQKKPKDKRNAINKQRKDREDLRLELADYLSDVYRNPVSPNSREVDKLMLWLELGFEKEEYEEYRKIARKLKHEDGEKYKLWIEGNRISPYTGNPISFTEMLSDGIQVEHILPYSKTLDNSFINKTLCEREINALKNNRTPYEYFSGRPAEEWKAFQARVEKTFGGEKQKRLLMHEVPDGFMSSQLTNTAYIGVEVRKKLLEVCHNVEVTNGHATAFLRKIWGLNPILNPEREDKKIRDDHRHHAIDALVIACTNRSMIQQLALQSAFEANGRQVLPQDFPKPFARFRHQAEDAIAELLVSYRKRKRLRVSRMNQIRKGRKVVARVPSINPSEQLHKQTHYGRIVDRKRGELFVSRQPLSWFDNMGKISRIVDAGNKGSSIRELVEARIRAFGGDTNAEVKPDLIKKALALDENGNSPIFRVSRDGKKIPINTIRVGESGNLIALRPNENPNLWVETENNYVIGIYERHEGTGSKHKVKRISKVVSQLEANLLRRQADSQLGANRAHQPKNVILPLQTTDEKGGIYRLAFTLQRGDAVLWYEESPEEIDWTNPEDLASRLYTVAKFDQNGLFGLVLHTNAKPEYNKIEAAKGLIKYPRTGSISIVKVRLNILGTKIEPE